jgi:uncharacterized protein
VTAAPLSFAGERLMLDPSGALWWPQRKTLVVADLHFEKATAIAELGAMLPPFDTRDTLAQLSGFVRRYRPESVILLGDSFHDGRGPARLSDADRARLTLLAGQAHFVWIAGNHDAEAQHALPGERHAELKLGNLTFRHEARPGKVAGEISGHFHPKARVTVRGGTICRPCFVIDGYRLMLPALGAYTGGLEVTEAPIALLFSRGGRVCLLGRERLHTFPFAASRPRAATNV